jgi:glycosyltransferase involved in cell wall biosynthesis
MADIFVLLSREESIPLSLLEAQQVGLPCIVSRVGDMPLYVEHGKTGFICNPQDEMIISCLLTELYENTALRLSMAENVLKKSTKKVDSAQQYSQLYQQILDSSFHVKTFQEK